MGRVLVSKEDLRQVIAWRQAQATGLGAQCFALAGVILAPLLAAIFDGTLEVWHLFCLIPGFALAAASGLVWHRRARREQTAYLEVVARPAPSPPPGVITW